VLQIASDDGENVAQCTDGVVSGSGCTIEQHGSNNNARCIERSNAPVASQDCTITQTGAKNKAVVDQLIVQNGDATQTGTQTANVTQGPASGGSAAANALQLSQRVKQNTGGGEGDDNNDNNDNNGGGDRRLAAADPTQTQDAYQSAIVDQTALGAGKNQSAIDQSERQKANGGSTQLQNTNPNPVDCNPFHGPDHPNVCANVRQHSISGKNVSQLRESVNQRATTNSDAAIQMQGSGVGGLDGRVHQDTISGTSLDNAKQSKHQKAIAPPGALQVQHDPVFCCGTFSQIGGTGNAETVGQDSGISGSQSNAEQFSDLEAESNTPSGTCTLTQHASVNGSSQDNAFSTGPPCPPVVLRTTCQTVEGSSCFAAPPIFPGCEISCGGPLNFASFSKRD
jgi:hypothetical protein